MTLPLVGVRYTLGAAITRDAHARPFTATDRLDDDNTDRMPATRHLSVYTQDPATPRLEMSVAPARVPFEPLRPGPEGQIVKVIDLNQTTHELYQPVDIEAISVRVPFGLTPSTMNPLFAQQMTYAVAMATYDRFRQALGRNPDFAFPPQRGGEPPDPDGTLKLHLYPHAMEENNAFYNPERGALLFGYTYASKNAGGLNQPGDVLFTSLSHDVVVHETTHALLDGMRARFMLPSNADVSAFHEAFADLVALFQRFQFKDLVKKGIEQAPSDLSSRLLTDLARQWGEAAGDGRAALRSALVDAGALDQPVKPEYRYGKALEPHARGAVLVAAIFDAFRGIFTRKTSRLRKAAGASPTPSGELVDLLAEDACRIAGQFLNVIIRAVDYCPPVDITFGAFLRAMITADFDLVPDDPWGYREALVQAFRRYGIVVRDVADLSEPALLWQGARGLQLEPITSLAFSKIGHSSDQEAIPGRDELRSRASALGDFVTAPQHLAFFGLAAPSLRDGIEPPVIESIRTLRRIGMDSTVIFEQVGEIVQRRRTDDDRWVYGGATVVIDSAGGIRYAILKNVMSDRRAQALRDYLDSAPPLYAKFFGDQPPPKTQLLRHLHGGKGHASARRAKAGNSRSAL
jgi:hypothetical protein